MKFDINTILLIYKVLRPEPRKWVSRVLILAGLPLLSSPVWVPYVDAFLKKRYDLTVPQAATSLTGWGLILIGLIMIFINYKIDSKPEVKREDSEEKKADKETLYQIFSQIYIPAMDQFFHHGKMSMVYLPVLHFKTGLSALISSSNFYLHNKELKESVLALEKNLDKSLSFFGYFSETPNADLQKFDSKFKIHSNKQAREAHEEFTQSIYKTEEKLKELCAQTRDHFPDFDFTVTNKNAIDDYNHYNSEPKKIITDFELTVLSKIIELEELREKPTLYRLAAELSCQKVKVQVALDKMIKISFAKHLYPGMPYQHYTALSDGRLYYVENSEYNGY
ncbi:hypothetical protein [Duffyella gerundensis]|uniref:hypothetical protein n=1 Tax=Duffyella gerundensis TaxID=1619313 RepID=UPI003FD15F6A